MTNVIRIGLIVGSIGFGAALPEPAVDETAGNRTSEIAVFAGGCFWGVEAVFESLKGVKEATSGYAGGSAENAHYGLVSGGRTGHAESVRVAYDPTQISYGQLLRVFFSVAHDPTQLNRQGPDHGAQYRSAIFYRGEEQKRIAESYVQQLTTAKIFPAPIVTKLAPLQAFYAAEEEHQNFVKNNPLEGYVQQHDMPKLAALRKELPQLIKMAN